MANFVLGKDCKAYYSATALTSTSYATPLASATLLDDIKDLNFDFSTEKADITTRGSGGWKTQVATLKDASISFQMVWKPSDAGFTAILTAFNATTEIAFFALDGVKTASSGSQGPAGNWMVSKFSRKEGIGEAVTVDVELTPSTYNGWVTA